MPSCVVKWCKNNTMSHKKADGVTFHAFPKAANRRSVWVEIIRKCRRDKTWSPSNYSLICSSHFEENDLYMTTKWLRRATKNAIPKKNLFGPSMDYEEVQVINQGTSTVAQQVSVGSSNKSSVTSIRGSQISSYGGLKMAETSSGTGSRLQSKTLKSRQVSTPGYSDSEQQTPDWFSFTIRSGIKHAHLTLQAEARSFPKDPTIKKKWIDATGRPSNWFPTKTSTICSIHFEREMFQPLKKIRRLFEWAVPKLKLRVIFESDSTEPTTSGCTDFTCNTSIFPDKSEELNTFELRDPLEDFRDDISNEPFLKRKPLAMDQNGEVRQKPTNWNLNPAVASYYNKIIESPWEHILQVDALESKIVKRDNMIKKQRLHIKRLQKQTCRYRKRIADSKDISTELKKKNSVKSGQTARLEHHSESSDESPDESAGPEQAGPIEAGNRSLCCCCLFADGTAPLSGAVAPDGARYDDLLNNCFNISYPEEVKATASICPRCIATLNEGVEFKRRVLDCQRTMASFQRVDIMQVQVKQEVPTETYNITFDSEATTTVKEEPVDTDNTAFAIQTVDAPVHNDLLRERLNYLDKIHEEYDLSNDGDNYEIYTAIDKPVNANKLINTPMFAEIPIDNTTLLSENEQLTTEEEEYFLAGCKCGDFCHNKFSHYEIVAFRRECGKYYSDGKCDTNHMDIFLTGALACVYDQSIPKSRVDLKFRDTTVCEDFFMFIFYLNKKRFDNIHNKIIDRATYQWTSQSLSEQPNALKFLRVYSMQNSLILPGRFSNRYPDLHILPKNVTKASVYSEYKKVCVAMNKKFLNQTAWNKIWERFCPYIVHNMPSDLCQTCHENGKQLRNLSALSKDIKTEVLQHCLEHLQFVNDERAFYERGMELPAVQDGTLHCSIDFLQTLHLPHELGAGPQNFLDAYGVALFAVACRPPGETVVYVVPECVGGDRVNTVLSLLHHYLESAAGAGGAAQLHCGPLLRAARVLQYAAWRAARAARCRLAFPPPGHDARPSCLGLLKIALRSRPARCMQDLCEVLASTGVVPIPVAYENGLINVPIYNWHAFFDARNPAPILNIQNYCHFEADDSNVGVIKCKVNVKSDTCDVQYVFASGCLAGEPDVLPPAGFSEERSRYLYGKIRPHLHESVKDVLLPKHMHDPLDLKTEVDGTFQDSII